MCLGVSQYRASALVVSGKGKGTPDLAAFLHLAS